MRNFQRTFEKLGYTFQSVDVLEDVYLFYRYYNNPANKGVSAILLEGDPGCGKTFLSEIFNKFLGEDTEYLYTQCVEETNSDKLIATYNVPAIVKGDADKSIAKGILMKAITLANSGKMVLLTVDELDKAREALDSYFLSFLQSGKIETSENEILALTDESIKNLYVIFAKNNERDLLNALLRRCSVTKLPPMPPILAYKTLLRNFEKFPHDPKFLKFISKVYEAIYNEQMESNEELLTRLPALQEITTAISSDYELYSNSVSSTRRIKSLVRKLGKDTKTRDIITNILVKKFKYKNAESNYMDSSLDFDVDNPDDYFDQKEDESKSLIEEYIEKKDSGEYVFDEEEFDDPMRDVATILDNMKDDQTLVFLEDENKEKIVELGIIVHKDPNALEILFNKIKFKGNPNSRFGFLNFEGDNFIGLMKYKNTLVLIANKEYVSPRLLMRGLATIITIIYDSNQNVDWDNMYFADFLAKDFKLTGFNAKILSSIPNLVLNKMHLQNGRHTYHEANMKVTYDDNSNISCLNYMQKYKAEPFYESILNMCRFNPELALPAAFIKGHKFSTFGDRHLVKKKSEFESCIRRWERLEENGWTVEIDDFDFMKLSFFEERIYNDYDYRSKSPEKKTDTYVFEWEVEEDSENKKIYVYPKYRLKNDYLVYTKDEDFFKDVENIPSFQKEMLLIARDIYGNFVPVISEEKKYDFFNALTMSATGRIVDDESAKKRILWLANNILDEAEFEVYYDSLSKPATVVSPNKILQKVKKDGE